MPPGSLAGFPLHFTEFIASHVIASSDFLLLGEFNIHSECGSKADTELSLTDLATLGLTKLKNGPTHSAGHTLDIIFSNSPNVSCHPPQALSWSDHALIEFYI